MEKHYLRIIPSAHLNGGMELEVKRLKTESDELPKDINLNFFVGIGGRMRILYLLSHKIKRPILRGLEVGVGIEAEYRWRDIRDIGSDSGSGNSYALEGYALGVYVPDKKEPTTIAVSYNAGR